MVNFEKKKIYNKPKIQKIEFKSAEEKASLDKELVAGEMKKIAEIVDKEPPELQQSVLVARLFPNNRQKVSKELFIKAINKLLAYQSDLSAFEKVGLFRKALEYFGKTRNEKYPIGHACGSEALKGIIETGTIKAGGSSDLGEGIGMARSSAQKEISVAEMNHPTADYVELLYARLGAGSGKNLSFDADKIDQKNIMEDFFNVYLAEADLETVIFAFSRAFHLTPQEFEQKVRAKYKLAASDQLTKEMILDNHEVMSFATSLIKESMSRKHYRTQESEKRDYDAYSRILQSLEAGQLPVIEFQAQQYREPKDILKIEQNIRIPQNMEEKLLLELQNQYSYFLEFWSSQGIKHDPEIVLPIDHNSAEYAKAKSELINRIKARIEALISGLLYPYEGESEQAKANKKRLDDLANQYPCVLIVEGKEYKDHGLTFSQKEGVKPVPFLAAEERILSDIPLDKISEIMVPYKKTTEVFGLLIKKFGNIPDNIQITPLEYLEIKRLINHQL